MSGSAPLRVMIVDDQPMFAEAIRALLETDGRFRVVGAAESGAAAMELVAAEEVDVVLIDIAMPGVDGLETTRLLREAKPDLKVVVISGLVGETIAADALAAGATEFLLKGSLHDEVAGAILRAVGEPLH
jgi:DNA-binding NarL/FixJ family response regulator